MRFSSRNPSDGEILSAASSIMSKRRKHHRGGRPFQKHACRWCGAELLGLRALYVHQGACPQSLGALLGLPDLHSLPNNST